MRGEDIDLRGRIKFSVKILGHRRPIILPNREGKLKLSGLINLIPFPSKKIK